MTSPTTKSAVVAVFTSINGPLAASVWRQRLAMTIGQLESILGHTEERSQRFLDKHATSSSTLSSAPATATTTATATATEENDPSHRILELLIPTQDAVTQEFCTARSHDLTIDLAPLSIQVALLPLSPLHRLHPTFSPSATKLACFDMDSTLIQQEVIDELARRAGVYEQCAAVTEAAMRGDPPYDDPSTGFRASLEARVALLRGVDGTTVWDDLKRDVIVYTPGAKKLVHCLMSVGFRTAVLSGGFGVLAEWVRDTLGLDRAEANHLETDARGKLTGGLVGARQIVDGKRKQALLKQFAHEWKVEPGLTIAVGDGSNDLPMMGEAGLGIAFNAKPKVQQRAPAVVNADSLVDVLYLLGWTDADISEAGVV